MSKVKVSPSPRCLIFDLSPRETSILELLCSNKGEMLPTRTLLHDLWGDDSFFNSRSLLVFISKLRKKFASDRQIRIVNVRGEGYRLIIDQDHIPIS